MVNMERPKKIMSLYIILVVTFLSIGIVLPLGVLFSNVFFDNGQYVGLSNFYDYFSTPALAKSVYHSLSVSTITAIIVVLIAFLFCYGIERSNIKFKKTLRFIAMLPLFAPSMTYGIALIYLFGSNGIITTGFFGNLPNLAFEFPLYGKWGVILAESIYIFPAMVMMFSVAFKLSDYRYYEASEMLSASKRTTFLKVTLPSFKYTIISAFFAAFTMVFSDFGIPKVLGGNYSLLATDVYRQVIGQSNISMGASVSILLIIPSVIAFIIDQKVSKKVSSVDSKATEYKIKRNKNRDIAYGILNYSIAIFIAIIFGTILVAAFTEQWPYNLNFTTKWFVMNASGDSALSIYMNTIYVSLLTALIGTIVVVITAYATERGFMLGKIRKFIDFLAIMPLALPGLVVGLAYLLFFNHKLNPFGFMYGTFSIIVLCNIIHFFGIPYLTIKGNMKKIDKEYESLSETMGVHWYKTFSNVVIPISMPSIIESFGYYFVNSMMTISAVVFLYTNRTKVAAVDMIAKYDEGNIASAAAIAVLIIITNILFRILLDMYTKSKKL